MRHYCWLFFILCLSLALLVSAQDNIRITVTTTTGDGSPVRDLQKADFSVQQAGKPRTIDNFVSPQTPMPVPQLEANEYTNAPKESEAGAIFVVLDTITTRYIDERDMREAILKFLGRAAQAQRAVTLAILDAKGLHVYHDYRTGSNVLLAALIKAGLGGMKGGTPPPGVSDAEVSTEVARLTAFSKGDLPNSTPQDQLLRYVVDAPLLMFEDVGHAAYGLPGRKALVWVTNATPFDVDGKTFQFMSLKEANLGAAVNGAQVTSTKDALTPDQVKKLRVLWRNSLLALTDGGVALYPVQTHGASSPPADPLTIGVMKPLAEITGGKAFYGGTDPFPEILQISNGNVAGYVLGFAGDSKPSPDFHRLETTLSRPGVNLSAPAGYFSPEGTPKSRAQEDISAALQSPLTFTGLVFNVTVSGQSDAGAKKKVEMIIALPGDSGVLNEATRSVDLALLAVAKDAKGTTVGKLNENAGGQFPPEAVAQIKEMGFQLKRSLEVPVGDFTLHVAIHDNQTGRVGSLTIPLSVK